jgi:hypothetical protein
MHAGNKNYFFGFLPSSEENLKFCVASREKAENMQNP